MLAVRDRSVAEKMAEYESESVSGSSGAMDPNGYTRVTDKADAAK